MCHLTQVRIDLGLDFFRRTIANPETNQQRQLVQDGLKILSRCDCNMIAFIDALLARKRARSQVASPGIRTAESLPDGEPHYGLEPGRYHSQLLQADRLQMTELKIPLWHTPYMLPARYSDLHPPCLRVDVDLHSRGQ